jgi:hypothetical protein
MESNEQSNIGQVENPRGQVENPRGQVEINGKVYEVMPNAEAYEISKRVYRMLCDFPGKRQRFDDLLKTCGLEIKDAKRSPAGVTNAP